MVHSYFLADFSFRLLSSKYPRIILGEFCSWIELMTTLPFMIIWMASWDHIDDIFFRASIMFDLSRVYLTKRIIDHIFTDNTRDILNIVNVILLIILFPAGVCSYVENIDTYPEFVREDTTYFQMVYFTFISMTFIGYGSQITTD